MQRATAINYIVLLLYALCWAAGIVLLLPGSGANPINWATMLFCATAIAACLVIARENRLFGRYLLRDERQPISRPENPLLP
jgi:hypothetical protein